MALRAVPEHPKFAALKAELKLSKFQALGLLEALWHFTGRFAPRGNIGRFTDRQIETWLEWEGEEGAAIQSLTATGWIDPDNVHRLVIHDWHHHADSTTKKQLGRTKETFVSDISRQHPDMSRQNGKVSGPPEPVPEPVPEPEPVPGAGTEPEPGPAPVPGPGPEPTTISPTPLRGVRTTADQRSRWSHFLTMLKSDLGSIPDNVARAKGFTTLVKDQNDFDSCFREWWLSEIVERGQEVEFITEASHRSLTQAGVEKYRNRLTQTLRKFFPLDATVTITVRQIATIEVA